MHLLSQVGLQNHTPGPKLPAKGQPTPIQGARLARGMVLVGHVGQRELALLSAT